MFSFLRALELVHEEGLENGIRRHEIISRAYREGLAGLGYTFFTKPEFASNTVSSAKPPKGIAAPDLVARLKSEHGIFVAGTLGPMRGQGIRIGHLGTQAARSYVELALTALAGYLKAAGVKVTQRAVGRDVQNRAK